MSNVYIGLASFVGGALVSKFGVDLLAKDQSKKFFTVATAAGLRAKDGIMKTVTTIQENASDILAEAKEINEERAAHGEIQAEIIDEEVDATDATDVDATDATNENAAF